MLSPRRQLAWFFRIISPLLSTDWRPPGQWNSSCSIYLLSALCHRSISFEQWPGHGRILFTENSGFSVHYIAVFYLHQPWPCIVKLLQSKMHASIDRSLSGCGGWLRSVSVSCVLPSLKWHLIVRDIWWCSIQLLFSQQLNLWDFNWGEELIYFQWDLILC